MYGYEKITNANRKHICRKADELLSSGWQRRDYPCVDLGEQIPWRLDGQELRSWNFYIHCWDMLDTLLAAHSESGEQRYLQAALQIALDWTTIRDDEQVSPFLWYDMAVGLRAYRLAYMLDASRHIGLLTADVDALLWSVLEQHRAYLEDDGNIVYQNNHGYYQVAGQLAMGRRFAALSPAMARAQELGRSRLQRMLSQQFTSEGVHREHSPDYHRMVYETLIGLVASGLIDDPEVLELARRIEVALSWFVLPNRYIANFGDSDYRVMSRTVTEAQSKWLTPEMQYAVTGGACGQPSVGCMKVFTEGGYWIARVPSATVADEWQQSSYLAQTAAFHSRTHKHADDLSFIWSERGHDLLVDAGRYGYIGKAARLSPLWLDGHWYTDPNRIHCESTRAHNALEFDGINYPRRMTKPYGSALRRWLEKDGLYAVETECRHFTGVRHFRLLVLCPGQWLVVLDWFKDGLLRNHDVRQWFHFAPELQCEHDAMGRLVRLPDSPQPLRVVPLLSCQVSADYRGQTGELMQGWFSPAERVMVPATAFNHALKGVSQGTIATLFSFSEQLRAEPAVTEVNATAREGRLGWRDERGQHVLIFSRPQDGEISVDLRSTSS